LLPLRTLGGPGGILVDGSLVWINSGAVSVDGQIRNIRPSWERHHRQQAAGVISLVSDTGAISVYVLATASSATPGLLSKTAGSGTATSVRC